MAKILKKYLSPIGKGIIVHSSTIGSL